MKRPYRAPQVRTVKIEHTCHVRSCMAKVPPEMLMCRHHWAMVPRALQSRVWATYRPGQCEDKHPSEAWHQAADAAIRAVAEASAKLRPST